MNNITLKEIEAFVLNKKQFEINAAMKETINQSFSFLKDFSKDKIIYGINTGFGPMAQFKIDDSELNDLQYNLIRSHSSGTGNVLDDESVRAVLVARVNNFLQGNSGISYGVVENYNCF